MCFVIDAHSVYAQFLSVKLEPREVRAFVSSK